MTLLPRSSNAMLKVLALFVLVIALSGMVEGKRGRRRTSPVVAVMRWNRIRFTSTGPPPAIDREEMSAAGATLPVLPITIPYAVPAEEVRQSSSEVQKEETLTTLDATGDELYRVMYQDCSDEEHLFKLTKFDYAPNPITIGQPLQIRVEGDLSSELTEGTTAKLTVKIGTIPVFNSDIDLCDSLKDAETDFKCPLAAGHYTIDQKVDMPGNVPPGTFTIRVDVRDQNDAQVICFQEKAKLVQKE